MENDYIKETKIPQKTEEEKEIELVVSIMKAKKELDEACKNFEYAHDDLIDYYTYEIKATRAKFDYLVKQAKKKGIAIDIIKQLEIKLNTAI